MDVEIMRIIKSISEGVITSREAIAAIIADVVVF